MKYKLFPAPFFKQFIQPSPRPTAKLKSLHGYPCQVKNLRRAIHCPSANFGPISRGSVTNPMLITLFDAHLTWV